MKQLLPENGMWEWFLWHKLLEQGAMTDFWVIYIMQILIAVSEFRYFLWAILMFAKVVFMIYGSRIPPIADLHFSQEADMKKKFFLSTLWMLLASTTRPNHFSCFMHFICCIPLFKFQKSG